MFLGELIMKRKEAALITIISILTALPQAAQAIPANVVKPTVEDKVEFAFEPANFKKTTYDDSWIYDRMQINIEKRLLQLDLDLLLEPFKQRPGVQWWVGEHIGKFLHAASYAYLFTGDQLCVSFYRRSTPQETHGLRRERAPHYPAPQWVSWHI
jgi:hypothetical protein